MVWISFIAVITLSVVAAHPGLHRRSGHQFTLTNNCGNNVQPVIADTRCGYSPRTFSLTVAPETGCADAVNYSGPQPSTLTPGTSQTLTIDSDWVGRIFVQNGGCGPKGEGCSLAEYNLDTGNQFTPQAYDISNIQGFTQSMQISADGCAVATCTNANCGCTNAYPIGDPTGCGNDSPVKACGAGDIGFSVIYCP